MPAGQFRELGHRMIDFLADYLEGLAAGTNPLPVLSAVKPGEVAAKLPRHAPERGEAWEEILADVDRVIMPGLTHWQSPNFFAFFPANGSYPAILGDLLSTGLGVNGMLWATSPAATELETRVLDWLGELIGLPESFLSARGTGGGVIQGTASEATLVSMVAARERMRRCGADDTKLVAYTSEHAHSSIIKGAMVAGIARGPEDRERVRLVPTDAAYALRPEALEAMMREDAARGMVPFYVCATVGTTSTTANDPVDGVCAAARRVSPGGAGAWVHVDAAFSGAAWICPEYREMARGVEEADSVCFNPHKWLLTNFDCDCLWTRDRQALINALSVTPEYLRNAASASGAVVDYRDWQVPLGRRFRSLKLWFVLRHYGAEGLRAYIREHMRLGELFEGWVRADERFEVVAPRTASLVCFRLRPRKGETEEQTNARNKALLDGINAGGRCYLSHTVLPVPNPDGPRSYVLRMAIGASSTREEHVRGAWEVIAGLGAEG